MDSGQFSEQMSRLCELYGRRGQGSLELTEPISGGLSGAEVGLATLYDHQGTMTGRVFVKKDKTQNISEEWEKHRQAREQAGAETFIPRMLETFDDPQNVPDLAIMLSLPAHGTITNARTLRDLFDAAYRSEFSFSEIANQITTLIDKISSCWFDPAKLLHHDYNTLKSLPDIFETLMNTGKRDSAPTRLLTLASDLKRNGLDSDAPILEFYPYEIDPHSGLRLPNPAYYLGPKMRSLWDNHGKLNQIAMPLLPMHGDLHTRNIICNWNKGKDKEIRRVNVPQIIDFAQYEVDGNPFFDLAYLELDLLYCLAKLQGYDVRRWNYWLMMTAFLASDILPEQTAPFSDDWLILRPIRQALRHLFDQLPNEALRELFEPCWWAAAMVAGVRFARRKEGEKEPAEREKFAKEAMLYAAHNLAKLRKMSDLSWPKANIAQVNWEEPPWEGNPYPGLATFTEKQDQIFFGREEDTRRALDIMQNKRVLLIIGASGSGKSSLVRAGIIPALTRRNALENSSTWKIITFTPTSRPFEELVKALPKEQLKTDPEDLPVYLQETPSRILDTAADVLNGLSPDAELLLVIDQFEELFTLAPASARGPFIKMLEVITTAPRIRAIGTMRADFYQQALTYEMTYLLDNFTFNLPPLGKQQLREIIVKPAQKAGLQLEPKLLEEIERDAGDHGTEALPLVAYALKALYEASDGNQLLTLEAYEASGRVAGAIRNNAQTAWKRIVDRIKQEPAERARANVFSKLIVVSPGKDDATRRIGYWRDFPDPNERELILAFVKLGLLRTDGPAEPQAVTLLDRAAADQPDDQMSTVEVTHEALFREWLELKAWIDAERNGFILLKSFRDDAQVWLKQGRPIEYLWGHDKLSQVQAVIDRYYRQANGEIRGLADYELEFLRPVADRLFDEFIQPDTTLNQRKAIIKEWAQIGPSAARALAAAMKYVGDQPNPGDLVGMLVNVAREVDQAILPVLNDLLTSSLSDTARRFLILIIGNLDLDDCLLPLQRALKAENTEVRRAAVIALGHLGALEAGPDLQGSLDDKDLVLAAAIALGNLDLPMVVPWLQERLQRDMPLPVRFVFAWTLAQFDVSSAMTTLVPVIEKGRADPSLLQPIVGNVETIQTRNQGARRSTALPVRALGWLAIQRPLPPLMRAVGSSEADWEIRRAEVLSDEVQQAVVPILLEALKGYTTTDRRGLRDSRRTAAQVLGQLSLQEARPALLDALRDPDQEMRDVRRVIVQALSRMNRDQVISDMISVLVEEIGDRVRQAAVEGLAQFELQDWLPPIIQKLGDLDPAVRQAEQLASRESTDDERPEVQDLLVSRTALGMALRSENGTVRRVAAHVIGLLGPLGLPLMHELLDMLKTVLGASDKEARDLRLALIDSLGRLECRDAIADLRTVLNSPGEGNPEEQILVVETLNQLDAREAIPDLIGVFANGRAFWDGGRRNVRRVAALALGRFKAGLALRELINGLDEVVVDRQGGGMDRDTRRDIAWAVGQIGGKDAVQCLLKLLKHRDWMLRRIAMDSLVQTNTEEILDELRSYQTSPNWNLRTAAYALLIRQREPVSVDLLFEMFDLPVLAKGRAAAVALGWLNDLALVPRLWEIAANSIKPVAVNLAWQALDDYTDVGIIRVLLGKYSGAGPAIRKRIEWILFDFSDEAAVAQLEYFLHDPDREVRLLVAKCLCIQHRAAIMPLTRLLEDKDLAVCETAAELLRQIRLPEALALSKK